jgi:hypothetical protein
LETVDKNESTTREGNEPWKDSGRGSTGTTIGGTDRESEVEITRRNEKGKEEGTETEMVEEEEVGMEGTLREVLREDVTQNRKHQEDRQFRIKG